MTLHGRGGWITEDGGLVADVAKQAFSGILEHGQPSRQGHSRNVYAVTPITDVGAVTAEPYGAVPWRSEHVAEPWARHKGV